jgi:ABC-2 type transport system ATP-binding protein
VRENVFLYGALHRIPTAQLRASFEEMIAWAELGNFVDAKFQTLSSGMRGRLAFSVSRYAPSQIMLQDEALTAGDKDFARKCRAYYTAARSGDRTFVIATHDLTFVQEHCSRALWLAKGSQMAFGETRDVLDKYRAYHA